jgi:hypothetical protein
MNNSFDIVLNGIDVKFDPILALFDKAEVFAPESTLSLIEGIPNSGSVHHSSLPKIILLCNINVVLFENLINCKYISIKVFGMLNYG